MQSKQQQREHQLAMVSDWERSGLSQKEYCQERQIAYHTFYYWLRRSKLSDGESLGKNVKASFVKVGPTEQSGAGVHSELVLPDGRRLIFHQLVSVEFLKALLS